MSTVPQVQKFKAQLNTSWERPVPSALKPSEVLILLFFKPVMQAELKSDTQTDLGRDVKLRGTSTCTDPNLG